MSEEKDRVTDAKEERQKTLDKLGGDSEAKTYKPVDKEETQKTEKQ
jgi:hypothetical protein